jgi:hypothetical protein
MHPRRLIAAGLVVLGSLRSAAIPTAQPVIHRDTRRRRTVDAAGGRTGARGRWSGTPLMRRLQVAELSRLAR